MSRSDGHHVERLVATVLELSAARHLEAVQAIVRRAARELTGADGATFVLRDGTQCFYADEDAIAPLWKGQRFPLTACISGWVMLNGRPAVIEDIYADPRIPADAYRPTFVKSLVMMPVRADGSIAAIGAYWAERRLPTEEEIHALQTLANSTAIALQNARLYRELESRIKERTAALERATRAEAEARRALEQRKRAEVALQRVEQQLRQSQKMEAVGQLAGGVAHDFNNILSVILAFSEMAAEGLAPEDPLRDDLLEIRKAGERASALTKRLLAFGNKQLFEPRVLDLGDVARGIEPTLRRLLGERIELECASAEGLFPVLADPGHIEQILVNLALNARDAMPEGGKLTIETVNVHLAGEYTHEHLGMADGDYVVLAVSDTGIGMTRETQERIFDPFFTTKAGGKGSGLGLSTVYGMVKRSNGHIWVYSEPGEGTTFKVYLPRTPHAGGAQLLCAPVLARLAGHETVLLVEDDELVRKVARGILRRNGYQVIEAKSAEEALGIGEDRARDLDLVLTDVIMPSMGGVELIERLTASRPELRFICMSGYTGEAVIRHGTVEARVAFVQKPLTPEALLFKVREELDRVPESGIRGVAALQQAS